MKIYYLMYQGVPFDDDIPQPMFETKWDVPPIKVVAQADYDARAAEFKQFEEWVSPQITHYVEQRERIAALETELARWKQEHDSQAEVLSGLDAELQASRIETAHHSRVSAGLQMRAELAETALRRIRDRAGWDGDAAIAIAAPAASETKVECGMCHGTGVTTLITVHPNGNTQQQVPCDCTSKADAGMGVVGHTGPYTYTLATAAIDAIDAALTSPETKVE
jgi:hypothetical protein